jgi:hypothetical protein
VGRRARARASVLAAALFLAGASARAASPFHAPVRVPLPKGFHAVAVAVADFDADGKADLAVLGDKGLFVLLGDGRGGFRPLTLVPAGRSPSAMAIADLDRDGKLDVVVANHEADYVTLLLGDGAGRFTARPLPVRSNPHPHAVAVGDFDRDGTPDIAVDSWGEERLTLLFGKNGWKGPGIPYAVGARPYYTLAAADLDGDGIVDLVAPNYGKGTVSILLGDGRGGFTHAPGSPLRAGPTPFAATVADVNGDGRPDVLVANYSGHDTDTASDGLTWIRNDGNRRFTAFRERVAKGDYVSRVAAGDVNGDGLADVAFPNRNGAAVTLLFGSKQGPVPGESITTMLEPAAVALADLDGDKRADLVVASEDSDEALVFLTGAGAAGR